LKHRIARLGAACALLGLAAMPMVAAAQDESYEVMPYATGLHQPRGLTFDPNGNLVVAEQGTGFNDAQLTRLMDLDGNGMADNGAEIKPLAVGLPSAATAPEDTGAPPEILGAGGVAYGADGTLYTVTGQFNPDYNTNQFFSVWSSAAANESTNPLRTVNPYAQLAQYEVANNPDGAQIDSNPYSIVVDADGNAYVNDAGANATLKVAPDGTISTFAVYPSVAVPADLAQIFGFDFTDAVPTGLAMGPDGALYVSLLTGFPFSEGASMVYRLDDADGNGNAMDDGEMTVFADGLTTSTALAFGPDGTLYATEFRGPLTDETGMNIATGRVVEWADGAWDTVADGLTTPTGLAVGADGTIYVSEEFAGVVMSIHESGEETDGGM
jgi:glucose/arabinose dehydrogenase